MDSVFVDDAFILHASDIWLKIIVPIMMIIIAQKVAEHFSTRREAEKKFIDMQMSLRSIEEGKVSIKYHNDSISRVHKRMDDLSASVTNEFKEMRREIRDETDKINTNILRLVEKIGNSNNQNN